jgi:hypothetical protein
MRKVAERMGCCVETVDRWLEKYDIEKHNQTDFGDCGSQGGRPQVFNTRYVVYNGYTAYRGDSEGTIVPIHQLTAIAEGADPKKVFSNGEYQVHHKNRIKFDNRPSNLQLLTRDEHMEKHT